jgi:hypothetical protein
MFIGPPPAPPEVCDWSAHAHCLLGAAPASAALFPLSSAYAGGVPNQLVALPIELPGAPSLAPPPTIVTRLKLMPCEVLTKTATLEAPGMPALAFWASNSTSSNVTPVCRSSIASAYPLCAGATTTLFAAPYVHVAQSSAP